MRHHAFTAAIGFVAAAAFVPLSVTEAAAADPTGIWRKADQGERPGKMEVFRCGSGKRYICAKIVWLQNPLDSKGNPLRDVRNENPSLRGRSIMGLPIINGMAPVGANQWKGNIYNPEDGNTYSATLTLVSRNQINLRGCKGWILCGERTWLRTSLPKPEPEPEEQIEASAEPESAPATETAAAEPQAEPAAAPEPETATVSNAEVLTPVTHAASHPGYRFLNGSTEAEDQAGFSGENVSSMFAMTRPVEDEAEGPAAAAAPASQAQPAPTPVAQPKPAAPQPKPQTIQASVTPTPKPQPQAAPRPAAAPATVAEPAEPIDDGSESIDTMETETAEAGVDAQNLSRRERRALRRQQRTIQQEGQGLLPWLR